MIFVITSHCLKWSLHVFWVLVSFWQVLVSFGEFWWVLANCWHTKMYFSLFLWHMLYFAEFWVTNGLLCCLCFCYFLTLLVGSVDLVWLVIYRIPSWPIAKTMSAIQNFNQQRWINAHLMNVWFARFPMFSNLCVGSIYNT